MFHAALLPGGLGPTTLGLVALVVILIGIPLLGHRRRKQRSLERKQKRLSYQWAWDWVFERRVRRLTDQRSSDDRPSDP